MNMVSIKEKTINEKKYYYLEHSYRKNGKIHKKEKYLGTQIPKNINKLKENLLTEIYKEIWYNQFDLIKKNYNKNKQKIPQTIQEKELETFAIEFTYTTNKIEGSTLTHLETALLLEKGIAPANKPIEDIKEAEQHREVFYDMIKYEKNINISTLIHWHQKLFQFTKKENAGKIRTYKVGISGSKHVPPDPFELDTLISDLFRWYNQNKNKIHPVHLAALIHFRFVSIHPFGDGNGRISRLFMNYILHQNDYPMLIINYTNRKSYYNALETSNLKNDENKFALWFFRRYLKEHKNYIN